MNGDTIDSFLLSCRILGKGIERAFLNKILLLLKESGLKTVLAHYAPTAKNAQVKDFFDRCGFHCEAEDAEGNKSYTIDFDSADLSVKEYYHIIVK